MIDVKHLQVNYSDIEVQEELGKGAFAKVYKGIYKKDIIAVKLLTLFDEKANDGLDQSEIGEKYAEFRREVLVMR